MKQDNIQTLLNELTDQDVSEILKIVGHRCRMKNFQKLERLLKQGPKQHILRYGIFSRLIKENGRWQYFAGQSYPDEIRTLRELILRGH